MTMRFGVSAVAFALTAAPIGACVDSEPLVPLSIHVGTLRNSACGEDPNSPTSNPNPFVDAPNVSIAVRGIDTETGKFGTLVKKSAKIAEGKSLNIGGVPEGLDREIIVLAKGGQTWYGRDTGLDVTRDGPAAAGMALSKFDGFSCVQSPEGATNVVFPAVVKMGDGRILSVGGFTEIADGKITTPTRQSMIFDPRTGLTTLGPELDLGKQRGAATAVYLEETNRVVIIGGARELTLDSTKEFPLVLDAARGSDNLKDDYIIFNPETNLFEDPPDGETMRVGRAFARTAVLGDGTVLVMGGGRWPLDATGDDSHLESDIFDPEDNDGAGGFLDIPSLRGFYPRAAHSLAVLRQTDEGLTQLLVWGGTPPNSRTDLGPNPKRIAEIYKQSGRQQDRVNGTFAEVSVVGPQGFPPPDFTYFQELTKLSGTSFLATGGAPMEGDSIRRPRDDEAWLVEVLPDEAVPTVVVTKIGNLKARVFHTALSDDGVHVGILGGWNVNEGNGFGDVTADVSVFDTGTRSITSSSKGFFARGGQGSVLTPGGTIYMVGGEFSAQNANEWEQRLVTEIFTPSYVPVP